MNVVVIGGVAAGPKAASRIIRLNPEADVTLVEKGEFLSYAGCGLPYYVSGVVKEQSELMSTPVGTVRDSVFFQDVKNVHVLNRTEALSIDRDSKVVKVKNLKTQEVRAIDYDVVVLATGAKPIKPPIPGINLGNIFTLHGVEDAEGIKSVFADKKAVDVTIVGGGLIGIEMAEALHDLGARVTIIEKLPHILSFLDAEISQLVENYLESKGIKIKTNVTVTSFDGTDSVQTVVTDSVSVPAEIVILAIGVRPNVVLAKEAGLEIGDSGAIKVNDKMQTSDPAIYAAGDCVEVVNLITQKKCFMPLGSTANKQGRVAASNICGLSDSFPGILNTAICKIFDYGVATTGLTEKKAKEEGFSVVTVLSPAPDRAHFYPTASPIMMKLVIDKNTRKLLGMQIIGSGAIDKRVDIAVTALSAGMTVDQIANLDLAYAPPYSPAMDNLITAANVGRNKLDQTFEWISPEELKVKIDQSEDIVLLDVRSDSEVKMMRLTNSLHIPLGKLRNRIKEIPQNKEIIAFCKISLRGYEAGLILKSNGFSNVKVLDGGLLMWPFQLERGE